MNPTYNYYSPTRQTHLAKFTFSSARLRLLFFCVSLLLTSFSVNAQTIHYVKPIASGVGNGLSWTDAADDLEATIQNAVAGDEVWVAAGIYKPIYKPYDAGIEISTADDRDLTFHLKDGVKLYGGFAGNETFLASRLISTNPTVLSGDIGALGDISDNIYHIVLASALSTGGGGIVLDGFTITGGNANVSRFIVINNNNINSDFGGGVYVLFGVNTIANNTIINNAGLTSGGIGTVSGTNLITNNALLNNSANSGGGISTDLGNNTIANNIIGHDNADNGGGLFTSHGTASIINNTFLSNNAAMLGGGYFSNASTNTLSNNIFWGNTQDSSAILIGADYYADNAHNNTFFNNSLQLSSSNYPLSNAMMGLGAMATGNIFANNPLFMNAYDIDGADNLLYTADDGLRLDCGSPAYNAGTNTGIPSTDILGNTRPSFTTADIGAYESTYELSHFVSLSSNSPQCALVTLSATGNNLYNFGAGFTNLPTSTVSTSGTYSVTVQNSFGCTASDSTAVVVTPSTSNTTTISACGTYTWTIDSINYSTSGIYNVVVACHTEILNLTINSIPIISFIDTISTCNSLSFTAEGGTSYAWSGGNTPNAATNTFDSGGSYGLTVSSALGCTTSSPINISNDWAANTIHLAPSTAFSGALHLQNACESANWTYYEDPTNAGKFLFAINWNPDGGADLNAAQKALTINPGASAYGVFIDAKSPISGTAAVPASPAIYNIGDGTTGWYESINTASSEATFAMQRYWNVNVGGGALAKPVDLRFYFDTNEYNAVLNAANNWSLVNGGYLECATWFKTVCATDGINNTWNPGSDMDPIRVEHSGWVMDLSPLIAGFGLDNNVRYVQFDGISSFSGGGLAVGVGNGTALPLELVVFSGIILNNASYLSWVTASEINTAHFVVERSRDGITFNSIGEVAAAGHSTQTLNYHFNDASPLTGNNYYRLKMVDLDASYAYSNIINLHYATNFGVDIYPNPFLSSFTVDIYTQATNSSEAKVDCFDLLGRQVMTISLGISQGHNTFTLDTSSFISGTYALKITAGSEVFIRKLMKNGD